MTEHKIPFFKAPDSQTGKLESLGNKNFAQRLFKETHNDRVTFN